jgi:hypothetical protein
MIGYVDKTLATAILELIDEEEKMIQGFIRKIGE